MQLGGEGGGEGPTVRLSYINRNRNRTCTVSSSMRVAPSLTLAFSLQMTLHRTLHRKTSSTKSTHSWKTFLPTTRRTYLRSHPPRSARITPSNCATALIKPPSTNSPTTKPHNNNTCTHIAKTASLKSSTSAEESSAATPPGSHGATYTTTLTVAPPLCQESSQAIW